MKDRDIDDILRRAAEGTPGVDPALLGRVSESIGGSLVPVRPLPPSGILSGGLIVTAGAVAVVVAAHLRMYALPKMSGWEVGLIFPTLGLLVWMAGVLAVAEMVPGSRRSMAPWMLFAGACGALAAVFVVAFQDYGMVRFVPRGVACLKAGVLAALPVALVAGAVLRRGFAVSPAGAGLAAGTLAGLAGIAMLELHCPIFEAPHVLVWHIGVLPVCGGMGALVARAIRALSHSLEQ